MKFKSDTIDRLSVKRSEVAISFKILVPTGLIFILFVYFSYFVMLPNVESQLMNQKRTTLRSLGNVAWHLLDDYHRRSEAGLLSREAAQAQALEAIRGMRFGPDGKDYFWINDLETVVLMHPYQPALVGKPLTAHADSTIRRVFVDAIRRVRQSEDAFIDYQMQWQDDPTRIVPKLSYVKIFRSWGWVLGTGLYVDDVRAEIAQLTDRLLWLMMGVMVASGILCFYVYQQATAVDKKRRRAERINRTLTAIANAVNTTFDLDELYGTIHGALGQVIDVTNFFIALYDREKDAISFPFYQDDVDRDYPEIREIETSGSLTARVIRTAKPVLASRREIFAWAAEQGVPPVGTPAALWLGVPLKIKNTVIGVMAAQSYTQPDHFDGTDLEVFVAVSEQVAVAIDRKRKEAALHQSVRQYRMLAENQSDVVVALAPSGELTYCSPAIREFGGYEPAEEIGNHIRIYFADANEMERGLKRFDVMLKNHQPGNFEMLFQPVGRDAFPVEIGLKPVVEDDRVVSVMCVMRDISERKAVEMKLKEAQNVLEMRIQERTEALLKINARLENEIQEHERTVSILRESEEKLIQSERLAATGQLAASIAHEINSPLQGVTSLLNVIRRDYSGDRNLVENLDLINGAFSSIRNTVRNLLDLNRPGKEKTQPLRIQEIIDQTGALVKGYLKDNRVRLTVAIPPDLPVIMGSPQQLGQVFMNLINNAVEAMGTDLDDADRHIRIDAANENGHVVIRVADSGSGISKQDMAYIFDAFFTRKKKMGMGVGLAICHRIIEDHNGSITVRNHADQGAEFIIRLPIRQ